MYTTAMHAAKVNRKKGKNESEEAYISTWDVHTHDVQRSVWSKHAYLNTRLHVYIRDAHNMYAQFPAELASKRAAALSALARSRTRVKNAVRLDIWKANAWSDITKIDDCRCWMLRIESIEPCLGYKEECKIWISSKILMAGTYMARN